MIKVNEFGVFIKGKETEMQFKQVLTRQDKRTVVVGKITKPIYHEASKQFTYEDVSEPFWIDSIDDLIVAFRQYKGYLEEKKQ